MKTYTSMHMPKFKWLGMKIKPKPIDMHLFKTVITETNFGELNMLDDIGWLKFKVKIRR